MKRLPLSSMLACALVFFGGFDLSTGSANRNSWASDERPQASSPTGSKPAKAKLVPLNEQGTVLLDKPGNRVVLKTKVVLQRGLLEMLVCKKQTKEHESILAVDAQAQTIHAGLLALGAEPGEPVRFLEGKDPETGRLVFDVVPPKGRRIEIFVNWKDAEGKSHRVPAQNWVRSSTHRYFSVELAELPKEVELNRETPLRYDARNDELLWHGTMTDAQRDAELKRSTDEAFRKAVRKLFEISQPKRMDAHWVFAGSLFRVDEQTGRKMYLAEVGNVICVANFPSAMLDIAKESSASGNPSSGDSGLLYEVDPEAVPAVGTDVTVELVPAPRKEEESTPRDESKE